MNVADTWLIDAAIVTATALTFLLVAWPKRNRP